MNHDHSPARNVAPQERRRRIVEHIRRFGSISVADLEEEFGISQMTGRRDLDALDQEGLVTRTHGGAILPELSAQEDSFQQRLEHAVVAKERLAREALGMINSNSTIFLDSSTSAYFIAKLLIAEGPPVTILTNCEPTMNLVAHTDRPAIGLVGIGGTLRKLTGSFVGPLAVHAVSAHVADISFFSVKGVTSKGQLTDPDSLEAEVKRAMIDQCKQSVLLIDGSKLEQPGMSVVSNIGRISTVLATDISREAVTALPLGGAELRLV